MKRGTKVAAGVVAAAALAGGGYLLLKGQARHVYNGSASISPTSGASGTIFTLTGKGFAPGSTVKFIVFPVAYPAVPLFTDTVTVAGDGTFMTTIPYLSMQYGGPGKYMILFQNGIAPDVNYTQT